MLSVVQSSVKTQKPLTRQITSDQQKSKNLFDANNQLFSKQCTDKKRQGLASMKKQAIWQRLIDKTEDFLYKTPPKDLS